VTRIIEIENGDLRDSPGGFTRYMELRRERQLTQARVYDKQLDHVRREKRFIQKYKTGQRAKQARGRETRLQRFRSEMAERPAELEVMKLNLPKPPRSGDQVIDAHQLAKRYDDLTLFENFSVELARGDRVGIIGPNGIGKTTLVRCLLGDLEPDEGEVRLGSRLSVGYYRQGHEHLDTTLTVWEYLQSVIVSLEGSVRASEQQARDLAGAFLFSGGEQDKLVGDLSGGERSRMVLAGLVAGAHNLLVLDEPSNHLDIPSAERLEAALSRDGGFEGTLLLISHDRALLQATCDRLIVFDAERPPRHFVGTYRDLLDRETRSAHEPEPAPKQAARAAGKKTAAASPPARVATKTNDSPLRRLSMAALELRIVELEQAIADVDRALLDPAVYSDGEQCRRLKQQRDTLQADLGPVEEEWARRADGPE
jgi:ATP-binding cassette subfamily F protein 3